jgi:hypothetical protein
MSLNLYAAATLLPAVRNEVRLLFIVPQTDFTLVAYWNEQPIVSAFVSVFFTLGLCSNSEEALTACKAKGHQV